MNHGPRSTLLAAVAGLAALAAGPAAAQGRFLPTPPFRAIVLAGPDDLRFAAGPRDGVVVRDADAGARDVAGLVRNGVLRTVAGRRIDLVAASAPALRSAVLDGSGDLALGPIAAPSFEGVVHGPGRLTVAALRAKEAHIVDDGVGDVVVSAADVDTLVVEMHGAGDVRLVGTARNVSITLHGSGDCDARGLAAGDLAVTATGSGNVQARATGTARIQAAGVGNVVVNGHPHCAVRAAGIGEVVCG